MERPTLSADRRTRIEWGYSEGRMSHEIWAPRITDAATGEMVLDLWVDSLWDGWVEWLEDGRMRVRVRHYLEGGSTVLYVDIDRAAGCFWLDGGEAQPLEGLQKKVEAAFWRKAKKEGGA